METEAIRHASGYSLMMMVIKEKVYITYYTLSYGSNIRILITQS